MSKEIVDPNNPPEGSLTLTPEEQAIADKASGKTVDDEGNPIELPSDKKPEGEGAEGDKKFADKYDTVEDLKKGIESIGSDLPDYVLEGMSDEALEKHYQELQKSQGTEGRKHAKKEEGSEEKKGEGEKGDEKPEGVTPELWTELSVEFEKNGAITEEQYDQLNKAGIPDNVIDDYIDSIDAKQVKFTNDIYEIAGGEEQYNTIKSWAEDNIPSEQLEAIGQMDKNGMLLAMRGIKAEYDAANPSDGVRIIGDTKIATKGAYASQADYIIDVSDKRYGTDKRYTKAVDDKFANSKNLQ